MQKSKKDSYRAAYISCCCSGIALSTDKDIGVYVNQTNASNTAIFLFRKTRNWLI